MKPRNLKNNKKKAKPSHDDFFESAAKRPRKSAMDESIESSDSEFEGRNIEGTVEDEEVGVEETADEKRVRTGKEIVRRFRDIAKKFDEEDEDILAAELMQKDQLEESGRARRYLATSVQAPEAEDKFQIRLEHRQPVAATAISDDDCRGFSASKDGCITHFDIETGRSEKYLWPTEETLLSHFAKAPENKSRRRSRSVLAMAVSSDGRYLATGGMDRHVHLWDVRTRQHIQAFQGHRAAVSCLTFRHGTSQLFSGSFDRTVKLWNVEERTHVDNLFGHQSEILTIDCLQKERLLTAARDRTLRLWKVPEESQLIFRAPASSLECCCFINDSEYLSGSDDGSVELWSMMRKKPSHVVKNAHAIASNYASSLDNGLPKENGKIVNVEGKTVNGESLAHSWVSSVAVCRGSDMAASGAANGVVRLWSILPESRGIMPLFSFPLEGFVNSLVFAKSGRFLLAGVGQEPRLGRWGQVPTATNGVAIHPIRLKEDLKSPF